MQGLVINVIGEMINVWKRQCAENALKMFRIMYLYGFVLTGLGSWGGGGHLVFLQLGGTVV